MTRHEDDRGTTAAVAVAGALSTRLRAARSPESDVDHDQVRVAAETALFGKAEPVRLGRYVVLDRIADGGMGVVYDGYDPELHRRVALKLLHPHADASGRARDRLVTEARALAAIGHPNVVAIHDVVTLGEQVVIVMERVVGQTLAAWQRAQPRAWRDVVDIYREAGRGLAAAHAHGLVHRDFKPANAIIGDDGRVRVLDFGLARFAGLGAESDAGGGAAVGSPSEAITATGEIMGTLGYMAPEQLAGETATPLSDQFSFCVALHRAIEGVPPFTGTTADSLLASIRTGKVARATGPRPTPSWLRVLVDRGLAADPAARHASLAVLLDELGRERGWQRWRVPASGAMALAAIAITAFVVRRESADAVDPCDGGVAELRAVWNPAVRDRLQARFDASADRYAGGIDDRVLSSLERYRAQWSGAHVRTCRSHRRGTHSDALFDRMQMCLRRRLDAMSAAVNILAAIDASNLDHALEVTANLSPVADCENLDLVQADAEPPSDVATRAAVASLRAELATVEALHRAGRSADALTAAGPLVVRADALAYPPVLIDALLVQARVHLAREEFHEASRLLARAEPLALAQGLSRSAVEIGARRIFVDARNRVDRDLLLDRAAVFESLSRSLRGDRFARPLLLNNLGVLHMARARRDDALAAFKAAHDAAGDVAEPNLELVNIDMNVAMLTRDTAERERLAAATWRHLRDSLGRRHLDALIAQLSYAHFITEPKRSIDLVREACDLLAVAHPDLVYRRAECHWYLGFLANQLGEDPRTAYKTAAELTRASTTPNELILGRLATGFAAWHAGDLDAAWAILTSLRVDPAIPANAWTPRWIAFLEHGLGLVASSQRRTRQACEHLDRAIAMYTEIGAMTENTEYSQRLAAAKAARQAVLE